MGRRFVPMRTETSGRVDGIRDYTLNRLAALNERGGAGADGGKVAALAAASPGADLLLLRFNPDTYGRSGFALRVTASLARLRRGRRQPQIALAVHEGFVCMTNCRLTLVVAAQCNRLVAAYAAARTVFAVGTRWQRAIARCLLFRSPTLVPVGFRLPAERHHQAIQRKTLEIGDGAPVAVGEGFVRAVVGLGRDATRRDKLDARGRRPYEDVFDWSKAADRFLSVLPLEPGQSH